MWIAFSFDGRHYRKDIGQKALARFQGGLELSSPKVIVVMGSISDKEIMTETAVVLRELDIPFEMGVYSAHRTPERSAKLASEAASRGVKVLIAGAGAAAHLAGAMAAHTHLTRHRCPVVSDIARWNGRAPGNGTNAGGLSGGDGRDRKSGRAQRRPPRRAQIIATSDEALADRIRAFRAQKAKEVEEASEKLQNEL